MNESTQTVHVMTTTTSSKPRSWALNVIAVGVILALVYLGQLVLVTLLGSILLAFILAPVVELLIQFKIHRSLAAFIAVVLLLAAIYGLTYVSYSHAESFLANLPKYSQQIRDVLGRFRQQAEDFQRSTDFIPPSSDDKNVLKVRPLPTWSDALSHGFTSVSDILLATTFIPFLVYFMLSWRSHVRSATVMLFPMRHRHTAFVTLGLIGKMMRAFILGNLIVGLFMSVLSVAIFWALNIPFFYFIGFYQWIREPNPVHGSAACDRAATRGRRGTNFFCGRVSHRNFSRASPRLRAQCLVSNDSRQAAAA